MSGVAARPGPLFALTLTVVGAALVAALIPSLVSGTGALIAVALAAGGLVIAGLLVKLRADSAAVWTPADRSGAEGEVGEEVAEPAGGDSVDLRAARVLFFLGVLTVMQGELRPALGITFSQIMMIGSFALCVFASLRGHPIVRLPVALIAGVGLFAIGGLLSSLDAQEPRESLIEVGQGVYIMAIWAWTAAMVLRTREQVMAAVGMWTLSAAANGVGAIAQSAGFEAIAGGLEGGRATGFTIHANDLGGGLAIALAPSLAVAAATRHPLARRLRWGASALVGAGLVLSGSIAGMLAGSVATVVWLAAPWFTLRQRTVVLGVVCASAAAIIALPGGSASSPVESVKRVLGGDGQRGSGEARVVSTEAAWEEIKQSPVIGKGLDAAGKQVVLVASGGRREGEIHGAPVAAWHEAGILGAIGLVIAFGAYGRLGWRRLITAPLADRSLGWALLSGFAAWVVFAATGPFSFQQYGWIVTAMLFAWSTARATSVSSVGTVEPRTPAWVRPQPRARDAAAAGSPHRSRGFTG